MANYKAGSFNISSAIAAQSITGLGFTPKLLIFYSTRATVDGITAEASMAIGAADGVTEWLLLTNSEDGQGTSDTRTQSRVDACIGVAIPGSATAIYRASLTSLDNDGFTLDVTTAGAGELVFFLAFGGDDFEAEVFNDMFPNSTGSDSNSSLSITPTALLFTGINAFNLNNNLANMRLWMGGASNVSNQGCLSFAAEDGVTTSQSISRQSTEKIVESIDASGTTVHSASLESFDENGYTLNFTTATAAFRVYGIAFSGVEIKMDSFLSADVVAPFDIDGVGFMPGAAIFWSSSKVPSTTTSANVESVFGFATDNSEQFVTGLSDLDNVGTTVTFNWVKSDAFYQDIAISTGLETERIALDNFRVDGFALDQEVGGSQNEILFLAFEDIDDDDPPEDIIKIRSFPGALPLSSSIVNKYDPPIQKTIQDLAITKSRVAKLETANPQFAVIGDSDLIEIAISVAQQEIGSNSLLRISTSANRNISGFITPSRGRLLTVVNVGSTNNLVLVHEGISAAAPNRILTHSGADITLGPGEAADLYYDDLVPRWRLLFSS